MASNNTPFSALHFEDDDEYVMSFNRGLGRERENGPERHSGNEPEKNPGNEPERNPGNGPERDPGNGPERDPINGPERDPGNEPEGDTRRPERDTRSEPERDTRRPERETRRGPERDPRRGSLRPPRNNLRRELRRELGREFGREPERRHRGHFMGLPVAPESVHFRHGMLCPSSEHMPPINYLCDLLEDTYIDTRHSLGYAQHDLDEIKRKMDRMERQLKKVEQLEEIKSTQLNFYQMSFLLGLSSIIVLAFTWFQRGNKP